MTSPVGGGGFRVAEGIIYVEAKVDRAQVNRTGKSAGEDFGDQVVDSARRRVDSRKDIISEAIASVGDKAGRDASQKFVDGFFRDTQGRLRDARGRFAGLGDGMEAAGQDAGKKFGHGMVDVITGNMTGALKNPWMAGAIALGITAGAPLIASAVSGAILMGVGLIGIGGAIALTMLNEAAPPRAAAKKLGNKIKEDMVKAIGPFYEPVRKGLAIISNDWDQLMPKLSKGLRSLVGYVEPVSQAIGSFLLKLGSGFSMAMERAGPLLAVFVQELPELGDAFAQMFRLISDDTDGAVMGLTTLFEIVQFGVTHLGSMLALLSKIYEMAVRSAGQMYDMLGPLAALVTGPFAAFAPKLVNDMQKSKDAADAFTASGKNVADMSSHWGRQAAILAGQTKENYTAQQTMNSSMSDAIRIMGSLSEAFDLLNGDALDLREAESAYQEAVDRATESIDKKVKKIDLTTERGRKYDGMLRDIVGTTSRVAQAEYDTAAATGNTELAQKNAMAAYERGRKQLITVARQMGMSRDAAIIYANSIMRIPKNWNTTVNLQGHQTAVARANAIQDAVRRITGKTIRIGIAGGRGGVLEADGGIVKTAADGLVAQTVSSPTVIFGERNTEEEAYIPKRGADINRSLAVLDQAADWLGMQTIPKNDNRNARPAHGTNTDRMSSGQPVYVTAVFQFPTGPVRQTVMGVIEDYPELVAASTDAGRQHRSWVNPGRARR